MKILVIEDERELSRILKQGLEENGFEVDLCRDGEEGLQRIAACHYDGLLLDLMLPGKDGFTILRELRTAGREVPVLIITARGEVEDRVQGLDLGADDFVTKPFDFPELVARLRAVIRRSGLKFSPLIEINDLTIDTNSRSVRRAGRKLKLSATEYGLLEYLALNRGRVVSRTELAQRLFEADFARDTNAIGVYINHLRQKLGCEVGRRIIHTIWGEGYFIKGIREDNPKVH